MMAAETIQPLQVTQEDIEKAEKLKQQANLSFSNKEFHNAIDLFTEAIAFNPNVASYYANRSIAYLKQEMYGSALEDASKSVELDSGYVKGYYRRASANMALGKLKEAIRDLRVVCKASPQDKDARVKLSQCEKELKRIEFEKAIDFQATVVSIEERIGDVDAIVVEASYKGPHLVDGLVSLEFASEMLKWLKNRSGNIHRKYVLQLVLQAKRLFKTLPAVVDVKIASEARLTICGDIHGQFYDLLHVFDTNGLPSPSNMYLFNGDIVDRGSFSVECILTLLCFKLLYPDSMHLARGNHEANDMNKVYGFEGEVKAKYDPLLFSLFAETFNCMPLGHIVMDKLLVVHGGLFSRDDVTLDELRSIDRFRQPGSDGLMCEMLWSDPQQALGRAPSKRGIGIQFGPDVTRAFLEHNGLQMVIRSHEMMEGGYRIDHDGMCVTVFSAPNYCDTSGNLGAYIHVTHDVQLTYHTFKAVPHPPVPAMKYATSFMGGMF